MQMRGAWGWPIPGSVRPWGPARGGDLGVTLAPDRMSVSMLDLRSLRQVGGASSREPADAPYMSDTLARYLAQQIRAERARLGLSQEALGLRLGLSKTGVSTLETGVRHLKAAELPELCEALGVDLVTFLSRASPEDKRRLGL